MYLSPNGVLVLDQAEREIVREMELDIERVMNQVFGDVDMSPRRKEKATPAEVASVA